MIDRWMNWQTVISKQMQLYFSNWEQEFRTIGPSLVVQWKESTCQCRRCREHGFDPWVTKIPWSRKWEPTPVFLPVKFHGQRSLVGYSPWGCQEWDMTEQLSTHIHAFWTLTSPPPPFKMKLKQFRDSSIRTISFSKIEYSIWNWHNERHIQPCSGCLCSETKSSINLEEYLLKHTTFIWG